MFMDIYMCSKSCKTINREEINQMHGSLLPLDMEGGEGDLRGEQGGF